MRGCSESHNQVYPTQVKPTTQIGSYEKLHIKPSKYIYYIY